MSIFIHDGSDSLSSKVIGGSCGVRPAPRTPGNVRPVIRPEGLRPAEAGENGRRIERRYRCRSSTGEDWRPCPHALLRLGDLFHAHVAADVIARAASVLVVLCPGNIQPHVRRDVIRRHTGSLPVGVPLFSSTAQPSDGFRVVLRYVLANEVQGAKVVLRVGVT